MRRPLEACAAIVLALLATATHAQQAMTRVEAVRVGLHPDRTRVVLDTSGPVDYRLSRLSDPARVVLDIENAKFTGAASDQEFAGGAVRAVRHARRGSTDLRVVLDLRSEAFTLRRFSLAADADTGRGHRLVIDLLPDTQVAAAEPPEQLEVEDRALSAAVEPVEEVQAGVLEDSAVSAESRAADAVDESLDDFFSLAPSGSASAGPQLAGYFEASSAYTVAKPEHWSKLRARLELAVTGDIGESVRYKLAGRLDADGAYVVEDDFYPGPVRDDQRFEAQIREFYVDFGSGAWTHRVGRQHIVWGEMVGLFLADVVSARDTREFFLQDFEAMRIPQWAWNTQYFAGDSTLEFVYIPYQSVDNIGEPGADFYPFPLPAGTPVRDERPDRDLSNFNWGARGSTLVNGWSLSAYYYDSVSVAPTLIAGPDSFSLQYDDLQQFGGTFSKDMGGFIFKGEAVYVRDRRFQSFAPDDLSALPSSAALDWVVGSTIPLGDWRIDLQLYGRSTADHDPRMGFDADEFGTTLLVNYAASSRLELEVLALAGLNREDYLIRPKLAWRFAKDWRLQAGADVFGGSEVGLFGPYDNRDRVYLEVKRWF